jgi:regulatory protein
LAERKKPTALDKALRLLAARARTSQELLRALERSGYPENDRNSALARLRELGYMDDREVVRERARSRALLGEAPRLTAQRLEAQGVSASLASEAVQEAAGGATEEELASRALQRRLRGRVPRDQREKQRLVRALVAKGHRPQIAARVVGIDWEGDDEA